MTLEQRIQNALGMIGFTNLSLEQQLEDTTVQLGTLRVKYGNIQEQLDKMGFRYDETTNSISPKE